MTFPTQKEEILLAGFEEKLPGNGYRIGAVTYFENHCEVQNGVGLDEMQFHLQRWTVFKERANMYVGDLLNSLNEKFGEVAAQIESTLGYTYGTQAKIKSVMKAFPPEKRHDGLKFAHYAKAQGWEDADDMLLKAAEEGWTADEMANERPDQRKTTPLNRKQEPVDPTVVSVRNVSMEFVTVSVVKNGEQEEPVSLEPGGIISFVSVGDELWIS